MSRAARYAEAGLIVYYGGLASVAHVEDCERYNARRNNGRLLPPEETGGLWEEVIDFKRRTTP